MTQPIPADSSSPLLTLLIGARNDGYMGNFAWRLETCLNFLGENLAAIGRLKDVEVLICDWNSPSPVQDILFLRPAVASITKFIIVPAEVAIPLQKDSTFPIPVVQNIAIRRARGTYIAQTDSDILFTKEALTKLFRVLDGESTLDVAPQASLLVASRRHVPWEFASAEPTLAEMEAYLNRSGNEMPVEKLMPGYATPSSLAMLHREVWAACRGYDERLVNWGWMEIDLYLRLCQRHPWRDLASQGVVLFHLEHYPNNNRQTTPRKMNPMAVVHRYDTDDETWGHPEIDLQIVPAVAREKQTRPVRKTLPKTKQEALAAAVAPEIKQLLMKCAKNFAATAHHEAFVPSETQLCAIATWLVDAIRPRSFLSYSNGRTDIAAIVETLMPVCSVYLTEPNATGHQDMKPFLQVAVSSGHKGHMQFIGGGDDDSIARIAKIVNGKVDFIFAEFKSLEIPARGAELLPQLLNLLSDRGALLFRLPKPPSFATLDLKPWQTALDLGHNLGMVDSHRTE